MGCHTGAYAVVARLLAAGADPCCDLRVYPDGRRADAEAATKRLAEARAAGKSVPDMTHVARPGKGKVIGISCALAIALRCGDDRLLELVTGDRGGGAPPLRPNSLYVIDTGCFVSPLSLALAAPPRRAADMVHAALSLGADPNAPIAWTTAEGTPDVMGLGNFQGRAGSARDAAAATLGPIASRLRVTLPLSIVVASSNGRPILPPDTVEAITRALVGAGARLNAFDSDGCPPVTAALRQLCHSHNKADADSITRFIEVLLDLGAGPDCRSVAPSIALRPVDAISMLPFPGDLPPELLLRVLQALKRAGASFLPLPFHIEGSNPEADHTVSATDYLQICIARGRADVLRFLVSPEGGGVPPDTRCALASKSTLLHAACVLGDPACVEVLLEAGADPRLRNATGGATPLDDVRSQLADGPGSALSKAMGRRSDRGLKAIVARLEAAMVAWAGRPEPGGGGGLAASLLRLPTADDERIIAAGGCPLGDLAAQHAAFEIRSRLQRGDIRSAAERGDLASQYLVAQEIVAKKGDLREAFAWLARAAAGNVADACAQLGFAHEVGEGGLAAGSPEAPRLYLRAAEAGHKFARYRLGVCYSKGRGIAKDDKVAVSHWRIAADAGWAPAQADLSNALINGIGTPVDYAEGRKYALLADSQGHPHGPLQLGVLALNGWGEPLNHTAGIDHFARAAAAGEEQAVGLLRRFAGEGDSCAAAALQKLAQQQPGRPQGRLDTSSSSRKAGP